MDPELIRFLGLLGGTAVPFALIVLASESPTVRRERKLRELQDEVDVPIDTVIRRAELKAEQEWKVQHGARTGNHARQGRDDA